jgi:hypothetical protein
MDTKKNINFGKVLIFIIGLLFTLYSIFLTSLALFGAETNAEITSYRKQLGERDETIPNQYTYLYGYEFNYKGKTYSGTGQQIGSPIVLKNEGNSYIKVRFSPLFPQLNSAFNGKKTILNLGISLVIGIGFMLITKKME